MEIKLPANLQCLFGPTRYVVLYGGRGGGKSHSIATALLARGAQKPLRILCTREHQVSIRDSVHQLLRDKIHQMGLESFYEVRNNEIVGLNGTRFGFLGLRHNIANVKSWEGADVAWVEEAQVVSKSSWDILIPTIRKEGSQIIVSMNPELEEDETYQRFVASPPPDAAVVKTNWYDNPWFPEVLRKEKDYLKEKDPNAYLNIWEGNCKAAMEGAIFANELRQATEEGRICHVAYNPVKPVNAHLDLGWSDQTSVWFEQRIALELHFLRYYENSQQRAQHYIQFMKGLPYAYGTIYLPHDAAHEQLGQERTVEYQFKAAFPGVNVVVIPRVTSKVNSIEAARAIFPMSYFDKELCADGLTRLRRYHFRVDPDTGKIGKEPEHDINSNGADAFQTAGMAAQLTDRRKPAPKRRSIYSPLPQ